MLGIMKIITYTASTYLCCLKCFPQMLWVPYTSAGDNRNRNSATYLLHKLKIISFLRAVSINRVDE